MKTLFLTTIFLLFSLLLLAQENDHSSDTIKYSYCEILVMPKTMSLQIEAVVIFDTSSPCWKDPMYSDVISLDGKFRTYNYALDILNIMASKGWRYRDHYTSNQGGKLLERFLLEKRK